MSSVTFGTHGTIVTDSDSDAFYGEYKYVGGHVESEIYERSFPGASGVMEVSSGDRRVMHVLRVTWFTTDPEAVDEKIDEILVQKRVQNLSIPDGVGGTKTITYCRLASVGGLGTRISGYRDGNRVVAMSKDLIFKKVRIA